MTDFSNPFWAFIRGDTQVADFEQWLYSNYKNLANKMPEDIYQTVIEFNYKKCDKYQLANLKKIVASWLEQTYPRKCPCCTWENGHRLDLGIDVDGIYITDSYFDNYFEVQRKRNRWLEAVKCPNCQTYWYTALDCDDVSYILKRLNQEEVDAILSQDKWPNYFDNNALFWPNALHQSTFLGKVKKLLQRIFKA